MALRVLPWQQPSRDPQAAVVADTQAVLRSLAGAVEALVPRVNDRFIRAIELLLSCEGRVIVSGIGKSGHIGRKIAATLASMGSPSFFLHAAEAAHGDLGMVTSRDVVILISNSGETAEVVGLVPHLTELDIPIIALVGRQDSLLAKRATVALDVSVEREVCPHNLAPTSSTMATLAMGDALAVALARLKGFAPRDFERVHPGGNLGRRLHGRVRDYMRQEQLPFVSSSTVMTEALMAMSLGRLGLAIAVDSNKRLQGVVTDGDLRRTFQRNGDLLPLTVADVMTPDPVVIEADSTVQEAEERMQALRLKCLIVVDNHRRVLGVIEIFSGH